MNVEEMGDNFRENIIYDKLNTFQFVFRRDRDTQQTLGTFELAIRVHRCSPSAAAVSAANAIAYQKLRYFW